MPFDITQEGTTIIITHATKGRYIDFDAVRTEVVRKEAAIVIDEIIILSEGINYPIENGLDKLKSGTSWDDILTPEDIAAYESKFQVEVAKQKLATEEEKKEITKKFERARETGEWDDVPSDLKEIASANVILTTSMFVAGRDIEHELDIITYECAYGMNIFRDLFASVRDIVGGRSKAVETVLRDARIVAMRGLREEALNIGADAVIAIDLDYSELSGGGKSGMLLAIATGTAVKLK